MRIGYCRVSTTATEQGISYEEQARQLYAAGCDQVIAERRSAFKGKRPEWDRLWAMVGSGHVSEVLVVDQSRLSRSGDDMDFLQLCGMRGVKVRALIGGEIEVESYGGFVAAGVISLINQADSRLKKAKIRDGLRRRREAGLYACGKVPFGYAVKNGQVVPHPERWEEARQRFVSLQALEFNAAGWVAQSGCNVTPRGIRQWLVNPILRGVVRVKGCAELSCTPLISEEEWRECERCLQVRSLGRGVGGKQTTYLFTGLVRCDACGKSMHNVRDRQVPRLKCKTRTCLRYGRGLREAIVRERVIAALVQRSRAMASLAAEEDNRETPEQRQLREEIATLERVRHLPGVSELIGQHQAQLDALRKGGTAPRLSVLEELFADPATLAAASDEELRAVVIEFIDDITWPGGLESLQVTLR
jgi:DNA invertase Pin-like site-specific DNA recombinase